MVNLDLAFRHMENEGIKLIGIGKDEQVNVYFVHIAIMKHEYVCD